MNDKCTEFEILSASESDGKCTPIGGAVAVEVAVVMVAVAVAEQRGSSGRSRICAVSRAFAVGLGDRGRAQIHAECLCARIEGVGPIRGR